MSKSCQVALPLDAKGDNAMSIDLIASQINDGKVCMAYSKIGDKLNRRLSTFAPELLLTRRKPERER